MVGTQKPFFKSALFRLRGWRTFDVLPDGRFVLIVPNQADNAAPAVPIVMQNWTEELKRLVPVN